MENFNYRKLIFILLCFVSTLSYGKIYYVALYGNDNNTGDINSPYATPAFAFTRLTNGGCDTVYIREGVYTYSHLRSNTLQNKDGNSPTQRHLISNYPNEDVVFDFLDYTGTSATQILRIENCDFIHIRGIELRHNIQLPSGRLGYGFRVAQAVNNCLFSYLNVHHCGGWGVIIYGGSNTAGTQSSNNIFYRCDSHHHSDRYSTDAWGGSDGFLINSYNGYAYPSMNNQFIDCRSWWNSDDGWDNRLFNGSLVYDRCWAFWNGYRPGLTMNDPDVKQQGGNGYGYKLGSKYAPHTSSILRVMHNCLAFENRETGIQLEHSDDQYDMSSRIYNNTAYGNGRAGFSHGAIQVGVTWLRNNLSFSNGYDIASNDVSISDEYNASTSSYWYRRDFIPTADDFVSLNSEGVDGERGVNGELPVLDFLRLKPTSALVDAGIDVGLPFSGNAPDIGAYEVIPISEDLYIIVSGGFVIFSAGNQIRQ